MTQIATKELLTKVFWYFSLPGLGLSVLYALITHKNPLESFVFQLSFMSCVPFLMKKNSDVRTNINNFFTRLKAMSNAEFMESQKELCSLPIIKKIIISKVYAQEHIMRFQSRINNNE